MSLKSAFLELTKHCNLNCVHCYVVDNTHRNELTTEEVKRFLDELAAEGFLLLQLTGGEVLLRKDFFELAQYAKQRRFNLTIFTNGTLITEAVADRFASLRPYRVEISLHGVTPETCDAVTAVAGSYEQILQGVRRLKARAVPVMLKANVLDLNVQEVTHVRRIARELGVGFRTFDPAIFPRFSGDRSSVDHAASVEGLQGAMVESFRVLSEQELQVALSHPCPAADNRPCDIGSDSQVTIGADGYLYPCPLYRFHGFNLRKMSFHDAYHRKHELIPEVIHARWDDLEKCPDCDAAGHYHHCFANAMRLTGNPLAHIPVNHRMAQATAQAYAQVLQERQAGTSASDGAPPSGIETSIPAVAAT